MFGAAGNEIPGVDFSPVFQSDGMRGGDFFDDGLTHFSALSSHTVGVNIQGSWRLGNKWCGRVFGNMTRHGRPGHATGLCLYRIITASGA
jgi:hypothetical protein